MTVVEIPRDFLTSDMDSIMHMVLRGRIAEPMVQVNPQIYQKCVRVGNGQKFFYVQL